MEKLVERKLTKKDYFVVSSLLFALFFGAGNLIFPLHLGQLAGHNWFPATLGFLVTGVLLPLLSVLAIAITRSKGVYDVGLPLGSTFCFSIYGINSCYNRTIIWYSKNSYRFIYGWFGTISSTTISTCSIIWFLCIILFSSIFIII